METERERRAWRKQRIAGVLMEEFHVPETPGGWGTCWSAADEIMEALEERFTFTHRPEPQSEAGAADDLCDCGHAKLSHGYHGCGISICDCRIDWMGDLPGGPDFATKVYSSRDAIHRLHTPPDSEVIDDDGGRHAIRTEDLPDMAREAVEADRPTPETRAGEEGLVDSLDQLAAEIPTRMTTGEWDAVDVAEEIRRLEAQWGEPVAWAVEDRCFGPNGGYDGPWRVAFVETWKEAAEAVADSYPEDEGPARVVPLYRRPSSAGGEGVGSGGGADE